MPNSDSFEVFKFLYVLLNLTGMWPKPDASLFYKLTGFVSVFLSFSFNVLSVMQIYLDFKGVESVSYALFLNLSVITYLPKVIVFYYKRQSFYDILESLKEPIFKSHDADLDFYIQKRIGIFKKLQIGFQVLCVVTILLVSLLPFYGGHFERDLPVEFPFDVKNQPLIVYACLWVLQICAMNLSALNNTTLDILACSFMGITSAQLEILREKLKRTTQAYTNRMIKDLNFDGEIHGDSDEEVAAKVTNCIKHHLAIDSLVKSVESTFSYMFLIQFLASLGIICITEFTFILIPLVSFQFGVSFLFFTCVVIQIAIYCTFGNDVILQSSKIGEACYMSEWNLCGKEVRKSLFIIMERAKRPYVLTAGKFVALSLNSFITVMKSSFSYFTVLQRLYHETSEQ